MMNFSKPYKLLFGLFLAAAVFTGATGRVQQGSGLVTGQPGMNTYNAGSPGETVPLERPYHIAPPIVPHDVIGLEVSRSTNDCLVCHLKGVEVSAGHVATRIPASHHINVFTGEQNDNTVVGIRYNCLQCHVPRSTGEEIP